MEKQLPLFGESTLRVGKDGKLVLRPIRWYIQGQVYREDAEGNLRDSKGRKVSLVRG